jgi:glycosyltransferase involved in cell wall biosynthesis
MAQGISTIVICHNEEHNIVRCLESCRPFSDEIIVVDSHSTDRTVELARPLATKVIAHDWLGYGRQKQLAFTHATREWVFSIDADEEVSAALQREIAALDFAHDGYWMPRRPYYLGRWIRHSGWYPGYILRLFRRDRGRFTDETLHEHVIVEGRTRKLRGDLLHYSYRSVSHHLTKMNDFTTLAAQKMFDHGRRARLRQLTVTPVLEFGKIYFLRRGFLDGFAGLVIALLHAYYVFLKYAKLWELGQRASR